MIVVQNQIDKFLLAATVYRRAVFLYGFYFLNWHTYIQMKNCLLYYTVRVHSVLYKN